MSLTLLEADQKKIYIDLVVLEETNYKGQA